MCGSIRVSVHVTPFLPIRNFVQRYFMHHAVVTPPTFALKEGSVYRLC